MFSTQGILLNNIYDATEPSPTFQLLLQVSLEEHRRPKTYKLKPNGENIPVTNESREEYVNLYLNWVLNLAIYEQFRAFYFGFHSVCASNALIVSVFDTLITIKIFW